METYMKRLHEFEFDAQAKLRKVTSYYDSSGIKKDKTNMNYHSGGYIIPWILKSPKGPRAALLTISTPGLISEPYKCWHSS